VQEIGVSPVDAPVIDEDLVAVNDGLDGVETNGIKAGFGAKRDEGLSKP
jgi:hypothetical protein